MNTGNMLQFLKQIQQCYPNELVVMILGAAIPHRAKELELPPLLHLEVLPPLVAELNPQSSPQT